MATSSTDPAHIGPVHVDQKIAKEVLSAATGDRHYSQEKNKRHHHQRMQNWCKFIVQSPHHKGGYAITRLDSRIWPGSILFGYR
jgi:ribosomal protein L33